MNSIPRLSRLLKRVFVQDASTLARQMGVMQRARVFSGASLLQLVVFGWLTHPQGGSRMLARFAGSLGVRVSKQAIEERFTRQTGEWLLALLRRAVQGVVCAQAVSIPLLQRFTAVLVEDGSTISLPASLKEVWRGCGGSGPQAALKLTVRWDTARVGAWRDRMCKLAARMKRRVRYASSRCLAAACGLAIWAPFRWSGWPIWSRKGCPF